MSDKIYIGSRAAQMETEEMLSPVTRVVINVDGSNVYVSGDESGRTIERYCPWGDQAMADSVLAAVQSVAYQPYSAVDALLDPAAEIGDGITLGGVYSGLYSTDELFDLLYSADIAAPGGDEIDDEYPYLSPKDRQDKRESTRTYSLISKTAEEILLKVANDMEQQSASFTVSLNSIRAELTDDINGLSASVNLSLSALTARISNAEGDISSIEQTASSIGTRISNAENDISSLEQTARSLTSQISDASSSISTLEQKSNQFTAQIQNLNIGISNTLRMDAYGLYITDQAGNTVTISGSQIDASTIRVTSLYGTYVYLRTSSGANAGLFSITGASTANFAVDLTSYGALRLTANSGDVYVSSNYGAVGLSGTEIRSLATLRPGVGCSLGTPAYKWTEVYASTGTINTSDANDKHDISTDLSAYEAMFAALKPVSFRFNDGSHGRLHTGFIAQEVEAAMTAAGLTDLDFAGLIKAPHPEEDRVIYGLRYGEFVPLNTYMIQKLMARVDELERRIA